MVQAQQQLAVPGLQTRVRAAAKTEPQEMLEAEKIPALLKMTFGDFTSDLQVHVKLRSSLPPDHKEGDAD